MRKTIDVRGKVCPYPLIATLEELKGLRAGEELEVITDEPLAIKSIPPEVEKYGFTVRVEKINKAWKIIIRK